MHTGRFKLHKRTLAIGDTNGKRVAVTIPAGDTVKLIADPSPGNKIVDVLWEGRTVAMYADDLKQRGRLHEALTCTMAGTSRSTIFS